MTSNPWAMNASFYKLTWSDLRSRLPFATDMERYDAAERLTLILNETFTQEARKLAFEYEDRKRAIQQRNTDIDDADADD